MDRRIFLAHVGTIIASCSTSNRLPGPAIIHKSHGPLSSENPLAIAMWDFSWLLRQYDGGGFEDWERALDELSLRGYNALRIDCFPQFIANNDKGEHQQKYILPKRNQREVLWGNGRSVEITPREGLLKFLKLCAERNISIALSSWFNGHGTSRNREFSNAEGLIRAWDETLSFLESHNALDNILYVDLLNEYPLWHGYQWLTDEINKISMLDTGPFDFLNKNGRRRYNRTQINFYNDFISEVRLSLKRSWPKLKFMVSQTNTLNTPWQDLNCQGIDVLDIHQWMIYNSSFSDYSGYFEVIHPMNQEHLYRTTYNKIKDYWTKNKPELTSWLSSSMKERSMLAERLDVPNGCTEGWGAVMWSQHQDLDWSFIKECGLLAAKLGVEYRYSFNCSSNFTHPHFTSLWNDLDWHKEVTKTIRKL